MLKSSECQSSVDDEDEKRQYRRYRLSRNSARILPSGINVPGTSGADTPGSSSDDRGEQQRRRVRAPSAASSAGRQTPAVVVAAAAAASPLHPSGSDAALSLGLTTETGSSTAVSRMIGGRLERDQPVSSSY